MVQVWNTVSTCSAKAVASTISKLIPAKLDLQVKRKTKNIANDSKTVWWFVVYGSESDLTILKRDWDKVHQQTLWSLQNCYMSPNNTLPSTEHVNAPAATPHPPNSSSSVIDSLFSILCSLNVSSSCTEHPFYCNLLSVVSSFLLHRSYPNPPISQIYGRLP